jgi:hypothetical protein
LTGNADTINDSQNQNLSPKEFFQKFTIGSALESPRVGNFSFGNFKKYYTTLGTKEPNLGQDVTTKSRGQLKIKNFCQTSAILPFPEQVALLENRKSEASLASEAKPTRQLSNFNIRNRNNSDKKSKKVSLKNFGYGNTNVLSKSGPKVIEIPNLKPSKIIPSGSAEPKIPKRKFLHFGKIKNAAQPKFWLDEGQSLELESSRISLSYNCHSVNFQNPSCKPSGRFMKSRISEFEKDPDEGSKTEVDYRFKRKNIKIKFEKSLPGNGTQRGPRPGPEVQAKKAEDRPGNSGP